MNESKLVEAATYVFIRDFDDMGGSGGAGASMIRIFSSWILLASI